MDASISRQFDGWLTAAVARVSPPLTFPEVRKGVQAVSSLYVDRRPSAGLGARTTESDGKRAALSTFYAPLHFLMSLRAAAELPAAVRSGIRRVHDLGCGTGVVGAAVARVCDPPVEVLGIDRSGWALREARFTYAGFGVRGRTRRASIPEALPTLRPGDAVTLGWMANELEPSARSELLAFLERAAQRGHPLLVLEPLARGIAPWWPAWSAALCPLGVRDLELKEALERPSWIERLDEASGLDHRTLGARVLVAPSASPG